jgi:riboflavin kinase/FMN adenylyltransferase
VHFFNFDKNIYEENIQIELLKFIRDEEKFESIEALKNQLIEDEITIKNIISTEFS